MKICSVQTQSWGILSNHALDLNDGLSAFIGETGAGKSMVINAVLFALGLVKGEKKWVKSGHDYCEVTLNLTCSVMPEWLDRDSTEDIDADIEENIIQLKRRWHMKGRHKITCQGQLVTLQQLREFTQNYFIASTQHSLIEIKDKKYMLNFIDLWLDQFDDSHKESTFQAYQTVKQQQLQIHQHETNVLASFERQQRQETITDIGTVLEMLDGEKFKDIETKQENIDKQRQQQSKYAEMISLVDQDGGIIDLIAQLKKISLSFESDECQEISDQISNFYDIGSNISDSLNQQANPNYDHDYGDLIHAVNRVCKKYMCLPEELEELYNNAQRQLEDDLYAKDQIPLLQKSLKDSTKEYFEHAMKLSQHRAIICRQASSELASYLPRLGMPHAAIEWTLQQDKNQIMSHGIDHINIMIKTNPGSDWHPIDKVASGGELSRIFLALQIIKPSQTDATYIFDEIDTGISGDVAGRVGQLLHNLSQKHNILMISHLPQVACYADHLVYVSKSLEKDIIISHARCIAREEYSAALSKLLSSHEHDATQSHIQLLIKNAEAYKKAPQ